MPYQYNFLDGERHHTYLYKANYNEYRPRKLEWFEGKADAHIDTALVPNAVFHYDISPVMVVVQARAPARAFTALELTPRSRRSRRAVAAPSPRARRLASPRVTAHAPALTPAPCSSAAQEETQGFASFVTKICAVIGGIYTVIGLIDNVIYHGGEGLKKVM